MMRGIRPLLARLGNRAGRRGAFLSFLAVLDWLVGYSLVVAGYRFKFSLMLPVDVWGWGWIGVGTVLATGVFTSRDKVQFAAAAALKAIWAMLYVYLWWQGMALAWISVVIWLAFALVILLISGWPEPAKFPEEPSQ